jgi:ABC-2 type transport system permease protein
LVFTLLGGALMGALGLIAGMWAEKFDQLAAFQNFLILPLTMLSGVFYSVQSLPAFWQELSRMNPLFYLIDGFRFGFFAVSDASPWLSFGVALGFTAAIGLFSFILLVRGYKLRT